MIGHGTRELKVHRARYSIENGSGGEKQTCRMKPSQATAERMAASTGMQRLFGVRVTGSGW
jgi:hypothetical protein